MSGAASARPESVVTGRVEFDDVLAGAVLTGPAAQLAALLDPAFLIEAGWDPVARVLSLPAGHPLRGRTLCAVGGCVAPARAGTPGGLVCQRCFTVLRGQGLGEQQIAANVLPSLVIRADGCAVAGCRRMSPTPRSTLCEPHRRRFRGLPATSLDQFLADAMVRPLAALHACRVAACTRRSESGHDYCPTHCQRWRTAVRADPGVDRRHWQLTEPEVAQSGQVSLRGLPAGVVVEVLFGVQARLRGGVKIKDVNLRAVSTMLRRLQAVSIMAGQPESMPGREDRALFTAIVRDVRRALADPSRERAGDTWDLALFGHRGRLSFTGISQPWLADAAKVWAGEELPRHRGDRGAGNSVRPKINALARLSESLRAREDHGLAPERLGRPDVEAFLNRLAYLESSGVISRYRRNTICRDARAALSGIRALGLTRPGQVAAGLPGDVALGRHDIPAEPVRGEPGRDLPPEIMAVLCANLECLHPVEVRTATQLGIDTGRRPEDILNLPLDCLARDKDGGPVLVYDNAKADRLARRLPISQATAAVITAQQARVRARFPDTPAGELKLLPSPLRNPDGKRAISIGMLEDRHRGWADRLAPLRGPGGAEFDPARLVPYAYRHTYAQRHADAGVGIDVLAELLDHRNLDVTRRYYNSRELHQMGAPNRDLRQLVA